MRHRILEGSFNSNHMLPDPKKSTILCVAEEGKEMYATVWEKSIMVGRDQKTPGSGGIIG